MSGFVLALAALAFLARLYFRAKAGKSPVPAGEIVFQDMEQVEPLLSHELRLTGKPDCLVRTTGGLVPVEVKSRACGGRGPYECEGAQVAACCLLVEDVFGEPVPHGMLLFADREIRVPRTNQRRAKVLAEMRALDGADDVPRSHESRSRCRGCRVREGCGAREGRGVGWGFERRWNV